MDATKIKTDAETPMTRQNDRRMCFILLYCERYRRIIEIQKVISLR